MKSKHIIVLSLSLLFCVSTSAQFSDYDIGKPPDSTNNWILGIDRNMASPFYGLGRWKIYGIDTLYVIDDSLCIRLESDSIIHCVEIDTSGGSGNDTHFFADDLTADTTHSHDANVYGWDIHGITVSGIDWDIGVMDLDGAFFFNSTDGFITLSILTDNTKHDITVTDGTSTVTQSIEYTDHTVIANDGGSNQGSVVIEPTQVNAQVTGASGASISVITESQVFIESDDSGAQESSIKLESNGTLTIESSDSTYHIFPKPPFDPNRDTVITIGEDGKLYTSPRGGDGSANCDSMQFFTNDEEAIGEGVNPGQYYLLDEDNTYGNPWGLVKVVVEPGDLSFVAPPGCIANNPDDPFEFFEDDEEADTVGGLDVGEFYLLSDDNLYGMPGGLMKQRVN